MSNNQILQATSSLQSNSPTRRKKKRDLVHALMLRPAEVFELYGIPSSTLCQLCKHDDPAKRLPSMLTPGRRGRKGLRLIQHSDLKAWLARWHTGRLDDGARINPKAA